MFDVNLSPNPSSRRIFQNNNNEINEESVSLTGSTSPIYHFDIKAALADITVPVYQCSPCQKGAKSSLQQMLSGTQTDLRSISDHPSVAHETKPLPTKKKSEKRFEVSNSVLIITYTLTLISTAIAFVIGTILGLFLF